jgi:hypothetical protein
VIVVSHDPGGEALAEEVAPTLVAAVMALRVRAVEPLEPVGESPQRSLHDQVVVVRHQAERVDAPVVALDLSGEEGEEEAVVVAVAERRRASDASRGDVVDAFGRKLAAGTPHASTLALALVPARSESGGPWSNRHAFVTPGMAESAHHQGQSLAVLRSRPAAVRPARLAGA